ncbi:hypothetical protein ACFVAJ_17265 [Agromyces sp. NPDC057679]|uniref:hypothetical protein n=1 Tax=Agromyces sp. NPDC057679 TaxID=3346207 RepID=UPI0036733D72
MSEATPATLVEQIKAAQARVLEARAANIAGERAVDVAKAAVNAASKESDRRRDELRKARSHLHALETQRNAELHTPGADR